MDSKQKNIIVMMVLLGTLIPTTLAYGKHEGTYVYRCVGNISSDHSWGWHFDLNLNIYKKSDGTYGGWDTVCITLEWMGEPMVIKDTDTIVYVVVDEETNELWYIGESDGRPGHYVLVYFKDNGPAKTDLFTATSIPDGTGLVPAMSLEEAMTLCDSKPIVEELLWWPQGPAEPMTVHRGNIGLKIY
jgi:hypothetical protein